MPESAKSQARSEGDRLVTASTGPQIGLGLDIIEVAEFERLEFESNRGFYQRCFSADEIAYCLSRAVPAQHFAARFAVKEAAVKAFSPIAELAYWQIEVRRAANGAPAVYLWDFERQGRWPGSGAYTAQVSLSHTDSFAAAVVIVYGKDREHDKSAD